MKALEREAIRRELPLRERSLAALRAVKKADAHGELTREIVQEAIDATNALPPAVRVRRRELLRVLEGLRERL